MYTNIPAVSISNNNSRKKTMIMVRNRQLFGRRRPLFVPVVDSLFKCFFIVNMLHANTTASARTKKTPEKRTKVFPLQAAAMNQIASVIREMILANFSLYFPFAFYFSWSSESRKKLSAIGIITAALTYCSKKSKS